MSQRLEPLGVSKLDFGLEVVGRKGCIPCKPSKRMYPSRCPTGATLPSPLFLSSAALLWPAICSYVVKAKFPLWTRFLVSSRDPMPHTAGTACSASHGVLHQSPPTGPFYLPRSRGTSPRLLLHITPKSCLVTFHFKMFCIRIRKKKKFLPLTPDPSSSPHSLK